jgi:hypothetical protein
MKITMSIDFDEKDVNMNALIRMFVALNAKSPIELEKALMKADLKDGFIIKKEKRGPYKKRGRKPKAEIPFNPLVKTELIHVSVDETETLPEPAFDLTQKNIPLEITIKQCGNCKFWGGHDHPNETSYCKLAKHAQAPREWDEGKDCDDFKVWVR